jgi:TolB-like protein
MASLIPGFEYDIFISYRQKDNKYDGWVTEFVTNLKKEIEATFKEEISVYFDINPHDGLLETHIVDASLKDKLRCLVFIPVISQTYCDPKSFAWQHEFVAFNKMAKEDQFGREIKLSGGNVTSRILPVKIHDLDIEDKELLENEMGTVLRSIEFIYKSAGVNRPLRANEDHPQDNINKTYYRDQINKVANAVKEIITAIKKYDQKVEEVPQGVVKPKAEKHKILNPKIILTAVLFLIVAVAGYFFIPKLFKPAETTERSIAVLPFKSLSDDPEKQYLADGVMDAILLHLQKFNGLRVVSRTSVEQYRSTTKTTNVIGEELGVEYLLEGSFQKVGDNVKLIVQLIKAKEERHAWANEYNRNWKDIFAVQSEVAQTIAKELYAKITPEEKRLTEKIPTKSLEAYNLYLKAGDYMGKYLNTPNNDYYQKAVTLYNAALELDSTFARVYSGLGHAYLNRYVNENILEKNYLDSSLVLANMALSLDDQIDEAYFVKGLYYQLKGQIDEAIDNFDKTIKVNPNFYHAYYWKANLYVGKGDYVKAIENGELTVKYSTPKERPGWQREFGFYYLYSGFFDKAKMYLVETIDRDSNKIDYLEKKLLIELFNENFDEALKLSNELNEIDPSYVWGIKDRLWIYTFIPGHNEEAFILTKKFIEQIKSFTHLGSIYDYADWIGYFFWQAGNHKEAQYYFDQKIKLCEAKIKLARESDAGTYYYSLAAIYAFLGDNIKAYQYLNEVDKSGYFDLLVIIDCKHGPWFAGLRNEARFQKILQNMEARYQTEHERVQKWLEEQGKRD